MTLADVLVVYLKYTKRNLRHKTNISTSSRRVVGVVGGNLSSLSLLPCFFHSTILFLIIFQFLGLAVWALIVVSVFGAIVTETLSSCVLNPNVRVGSRSRYPNDSLVVTAKHTRGMTR